MSISNQIKIFTREIQKVSILFTQKTRIWCQLPYPNHPKGCPNFNKNPLCPPNMNFMKDILQKYHYFYIVYAKFDLKSQRKRMLERHPNWSKKQAECLLYWQNSVKKELKEKLERILLKNNEKEIFLLSCGSGFKLKRYKSNFIPSMEAAGINVYNILENNNIEFELKPVKKVILVNLLCSKEKLLLI
jgi:predicted metal-binding protein